MDLSQTKNIEAGIREILAHYPYLQWVGGDFEDCADQLAFMFSLVVEDAWENFSDEEKAKRIKHGTRQGGSEALSSGHTP